MPVPQKPSVTRWLVCLFGCWQTLPLAYPDPNLFCFCLFVLEYTILTRVLLWSPVNNSGGILSRSQ